MQAVGRVVPLVPRLLYYGLLGTQEAVRLGTTHTALPEVEGRARGCKPGALVTAFSARGEQRVSSL